MKAKKLILVLLVIFVGFWLFKDPNGLARASSSLAESIWSLLTDLFTALIDFVQAL